MATRLSIYNGALSHLGQRRLASELEDNESRRLCDEIWNAGFIRTILEEGLWKFAMRTVRIESSPSFAPDEAFPGSFKYAFEKSDDWLRTASVSSEPLFIFPMLRYSDEAGFVYADNTPIWVQFISDGDDYGSDLARWPSLVTAWAELYLAWRLRPGVVAEGQERKELERIMIRAKRDALSKDAMQGPPVFFPRGSWVASRHGGFRRQTRSHWEGE